MDELESQTFYKHCHSAHHINESWEGFSRTNHYLDLGSTGPQPKNVVPDDRFTATSLNLIFLFHICIIIFFINAMNDLKGNLPLL